MLPPLKFTADGLIPAIVQDAQSRRVLMMAWMNATSLEATLQTGFSELLEAVPARNSG